MSAIILIPILMATMIVLTFISSIAKGAKQQKEKQEAEKAMDLLNDKEEFKKFRDSDSSESNSRPTQSAQVYRSQPQRPAQTQVASRVNPSKQQMTDERQQRLVEMKRIQAEKNQAKEANVFTSSSHHDDHCDTRHRDSNEKYRVEYVPTTGSIAGKSTEGCQDHYNVRYVKLDDENDGKLELTELQKVVVYGEVINGPAFKRVYGKRAR